MDAPVLTYVGEICEPSLRGILISYSLQFCSAGFFLQCLLGSVTTWRNVAFISLFFPATAFLCISQVTFFTIINFWTYSRLHRWRTHRVGNVSNSMSMRTQSRINSELGGSGWINLPGKFSTRLSYKTYSLILPWLKIFLSAPCSKFINFIKFIKFIRFIKFIKFIKF